jgi:hypothetical protein
LGWEFDQRAFAGISVTLVGHKLNLFACGLPGDGGLAGEMGRAAQRTVGDQFSRAAFRDGMLEAIRVAQEKWQRSRKMAFAR